MLLEVSYVQRLFSNILGTSQPNLLFSGRGGGWRVGGGGWGVEGGGWRVEGGVGEEQLFFSWLMWDNCA